MSISKILDYFTSDKTEEEISKEAILKKRKAIFENQLKRFHKKYGDRFDAVMQNFLAKSKSKKYERWYKGGGEPPILDFFFDYAKKYGRKANKTEIEKYGSIFTDEMYFLKDYYIELMTGQGSCVNIYPAK